MLDEQGPALAAASSRRVLAISPPGWETPPLAAAEYRPTALSRRLIGLFDELGAPHVTFVGFSWGATIGCHLAATEPDRVDALVLLDAGYTDAQDRPGFVEPDLATVTAQMVEQAREFRWSSWEECFAFFRPHVPQWGASHERRLRAGLREEEGAIVPVVSPEVAAAAAYGVAAEPPSATLSRLGRLGLPILLVAASETVATEHGARALARFRGAVPAAEVVEVESGHDLLLDAPEATVAAVSAFLRGSSPRDVSRA